MHTGVGTRHADIGGLTPTPCRVGTTRTRAGRASINRIHHDRSSGHSRKSRPPTSTPWTSCRQSMRWRRSCLVPPKRTTQAHAQPCSCTCGALTQCNTCQKNPNDEECTACSAGYTAGGGALRRGTAREKRKNARRQRARVLEWCRRQSPHRYLQSLTQ